MEIESYFGAHGENIKAYQEYEKELKELPELDKVDNIAFLEYQIVDTKNSISKAPLKFYFQIVEASNYYLLTDNGDNYGNYKFTIEQQESIENYLDGSSVGINFENNLNLVYLELGNLEEDFNISFLAKKYVDAITYINSIIE